MPEIDLPDLDSIVWDRSPEEIGRSRASSSVASMGTTLSYLGGLPSGSNHSPLVTEGTVKYVDAQNNSASTLGSYRFATCPAPPQIK